MNGEYLEEIRFEGKEKLKCFREAWERNSKQNIEHAKAGMFTTNSTPFCMMASISEGNLLLFSVYNCMGYASYCLKLTGNSTKLDKIILWKEKKEYDKKIILRGTANYYNNIFSYSSNCNIYK